MESTSKHLLALPEKIVHKIMRLLDADLHEQRMNPGACWHIRNEGLKRGLAACSLTCRSWAVALRPALFVTLVLRCAEDLDTLLSFLAYPITVGSPIPLLVVKIGIELDGTPQRPWMHRLHKLSKHLNGRHLGSICYFDPQCYVVRIIGDDHRKMAPYSTHLLPFQHLPRPFPHMYPRISTLHLENLHLHHERALLSLVCALPELRWCSMACVSFIHTPSSHITIPGRRFQLASPEGLCVEASDCGDLLGCTQLDIAAVAFFAPSLLGLHSHVWKITREVVGSYTQSSDKYVRFCVEDTGVC